MSILLSVTFIKTPTAFSANYPTCLVYDDGSIKQPHIEKVLNSLKTHISKELVTLIDYLIITGKLF
jgi:hypothetical protein